ncbi:hypothetical protein [Halomicronema sp. CCY15110]|uniref:hypothetical protein n=1 Tax=Halomicronema sp. CCY15110 TaxID=2767773 RepID=UPI00195241EE|nr:hypothetical protein [Halomicronema sp. CCY15110]
MDFKSFSELREFIRRYNSTSVLEIGTNICWQKWTTKYSNSRDWVLGNAERNYAVRLMLLASAGNPHRQKNISVQIFDELINAYHNWDGHTIADKQILKREIELLLNSIQNWESDHSHIVRNWSLKLSSILDSKVITAHTAGLFVQRMGAFQNAGFGHPASRIRRTIKLVELMDRRSENDFSKNFSNSVGLNPPEYFKQFLACLALFGWFSRRKGFCEFSSLPSMDDQLQESGITQENLKIFISQNSAVFSSQVTPSFRGRINDDLNSIPEYYRPLFYNHFLEIPFVELRDGEFCLPDPFSLTESSWNGVRSLAIKYGNGKKLGQLLSHAFEDYLETVLFPLTCLNSFEKIPEVKNPSSSKDKRADFLIRTENAYILIECKSSLMSADTSAYFQADKLADVWCRIHSAFEQIGITVEALSLDDKPVIPLILTFYDSIAASTVFEEMVKQTDYCSRMRLNMPPVVYSLHEFEHWISNRSLENWSELIFSKQSGFPSIQPDNRGHNYRHLSDVSIL